MEHVIYGSGRVSGVEVLFFEEAELQKTKDGQTSFGAIGPLSVLYFSEYKRFVLQLNDWKYPLIRRLATSGKDGSYILPGLNGFTYMLRISNGGSEALANFDTILSNNSSFSLEKGGAPIRQVEKSPEDKLTRHPLKNTGTKEVVSETIKSLVDNVKNKMATLKTGTKNLTSTKKRINQKDIKTKDFKKTASTSFKSDFFQSAEKASKLFQQRRKENGNLSQHREFDLLKKTNSKNAPVLYICREDIEEAILNNKDIATRGGLTA